MCVFLCMGGNSSTWMNTAVLVTCIRNFRRNRGPVSGILKGYVGLSTAIFTDISAALFPDNPAAFLLLLAIAPAAICAAAMLFLRDFPPADGDSGRDEEEEEEGRCFAAINTIAVVIAVYLLAFDLAPGVVRGGGVAAISAFVAVLFLLLAAPASVPVYVAVKARIARNVRTNFSKNLS